MKHGHGLHNLLVKAAEGDLQSKEDIFHSIHNPLLLYIAGKFGHQLSQDDIADIANHVCLSVLASIKQYRGENGDLSAWEWAYRIAHNRAVKWVKSGKRTIPFPKPPDDTGQEYDHEEYLHLLLIQYTPQALPESVEDEVINRMMITEIRAAISRFSPRERLIIAWRYDDGLTLEEIACRLKIKRPRVHQILAKIHRELRNHINLED